MTAGWRKWSSFQEVLAYGQTSDKAIAKAQALALRVLADQLEHGERRASNGLD